MEMMVLVEVVVMMVLVVEVVMVVVDMVEEVMEVEVRTAEVMGEVVGVLVIVDILDPCLVPDLNGNASKVFRTIWCLL